LAEEARRFEDHPGVDSDIGVIGVIQESIDEAPGSEGRREKETGDVEISEKSQKAAYAGGGKEENRAAPDAGSFSQSSIQGI
jgi:hypothetical protein